MLDERQKTRSRFDTVVTDKSCDMKSFIVGTRAFNVTTQGQNNDKGPPLKSRRKSHPTQ